MRAGARGTRTKLVPDAVAVACLGRADALYYLLDSLFDDPVFHSENPIADGSDPFIVCDDN